MASDTGSMALPSSWLVRAAGVASAGASVISWPQLRASASRLRLAALGVLGGGAFQLDDHVLLACCRRRVQQLADLLDQVGPADLGGGGQAVAEHLAGLVGLACGDQQLAQCAAHGGDPVGSLQVAEDLERLDQPGEG